jgi:cutinase
MIARGTFEPGPFGVIVGDPLMQTIQKDMRGEDVRGYAVQYPAGMGGADTGINDVVNRVKGKAKECPNQKFALVGYSQGGMVVSAAMAKIPADLRQKVVAMVLYGSGNGGAVASADLKQKTLANCAPGDMCGNPPGAAGHFTYGSTGTSWHARSSKYIASAFHGKAPGYKLELSPN